MDLIQDIIGMTFKDATSLLKQRGLKLRVVLNDGMHTKYIMDSVANRVNVEIEKGKIVRIDSIG